MERKATRDFFPTTGVFLFDFFFELLLLLGSLEFAKTQPLFRCEVYLESSDGQNYKLPRSQIPLASTN